MKDSVTNSEDTEQDQQFYQKPVFHDPSGRRNKWLKLTLFSLGLTATILIGVFLISILANPFLPQLKLKTLNVLPESKDTSLPIPERPLTKKEFLLKRQGEKLKSDREKHELLKKFAVLKKSLQRSAQLAGPNNYNPEHPLSIGFYVNWDDESLSSLQQNIQSLDWVVPEWIRLSGSTDNPLVLDIDQKALQVISSERPDLKVIPLLQNYRNEKWDRDLVTNAMSSHSSRQKLIESLLNVIDEYKFSGLAVDIEEIQPSDHILLMQFLTELKEKFQQRGLVLVQAVPFDNPEWNYKSYSLISDYLMLMAYDEHWADGPPGPIASRKWFDQALKKRLAELSPNKTIVCFGNYGYDWVNGKPPAEDVKFQDAVLAAKESLDSPEGINFDPESENPHFSYTEDDGLEHNIWFLDAATAFNQVSEARRFGVAGLGLWRLGSEDPSVWQFFGIDKRPLDPSQIEQIKYAYGVDFEGTGEILQVIAEPTDGRRMIERSDDGSIKREIYKAIPSTYVIRRTGDRPGKIVLTFDDGPDPKWTPQILDILARENVKAAFFIVGQNGQANPELVRRIVNEGHEIGNHSFTHPNLGEVPLKVTEIELNTTQRLIEALTGHSTRFFRAPYFGDAEPRTPDEVVPTVAAQKLGYISIGLHIDPADWKLKNDDGTPHTADEIVEEVIRGAAVTTPEERGSIVLLHDSGGDRSATVAALPKIIEQLRARGYEFTTLSDLAGISRDDAMPRVAEDNGLYKQADSYVFLSISTIGWLLGWIFIIGIMLGIGRMAFIGLLACAQYFRARKREKLHSGEDFKPEVSIVVPAYNEEKLIVKTINSLLNSDYPSFEIVIVDDGSTDNTLAVLKSNYSDNERVQIHSKTNGGKAEALNYGAKLAKGDIIVALDADTIFTPQTLKYLVSRFSDETIGAVAGNAKVGNRINFVTRLQALEYITSQNFDRRAFASLNCITVVPGAVGAWRKSVLEKTGGFSSDTLAEDQDLTIEVRKLGYKIGYEERAIGFTEAPDTLRSLARQRFRWAYGTLQCMWKHKGALFNPRYGTLGFIAMPNVWIFQILFQLISPIMDLMFIWTLISAAISALEHQQEYAHTPVNLNQVIFYYALFLAIDWIGATAAFLMEKGEDKKLLVWLFIQRFGYRQVMYWVMLKSVYTALKGAIVGWGKLERKATVEAGA